MRSVDQYIASNISADTAAFKLEGGMYAMCVIGSSYGTVELKMLAADASTYVSIKQTFEKADGTGGTADDLVIGSFAANGMKKMYLPPGHYKIAVSSTTGVYASIVRVPSD